MERRQYLVPGMHCGTAWLPSRKRCPRFPASSRSTVDLVTKRVDVAGEPLDDAAIRAAIEEAGYEAA